MILTPISIGLLTVLIFNTGEFALAQDKSVASSAELTLAPRDPASNTITAATRMATPQSPSTQTQQQPVVTVEELIAEVLENNPEILAARRRFEASTKRPSQLSTLPDPMFSFTNFGVGHPFSTLNKSEFAYVGFGVSQEIPFPGKLTLRRQIAQKEAGSEGQMYRDTQLRVVSRLKQGYYDLYYTHKAIETLQKDRDLLDRFAKIAAARYRVGSGLQQDVLRSQVEISLLMQRLEILEQQRASQEAFLSSLLNRPSGAQMGKPVELKKSELNYELEQLYRLTLENAPRLRSRQEMVDSHTFALDLARKGYLPDFNAIFQYQKTGSLYPDYYMAMAEVKVPLYFWRKQRLGVEEAATRLVQSRHEYQMTVQEISFAVKDQFLIAKTAERLLALYEQGIIPQSAASLESALAGYQVGKVDFLTLINNLTVLLNFETDYYKELSNQKKALAQLEEWVGVPLP
jgi:outer membrane protein, heavy metal efflux system